jgi:hypothetical protein
LSLLFLRKNKLAVSKYGWISFFFL